MGWSGRGAGLGPVFSLNFTPRSATLDGFSPNFCLLGFVGTRAWPCPIGDVT